MVKRILGTIVGTIGFFLLAGIAIAGLTWLGDAAPALFLIFGGLVLISGVALVAGMFWEILR